MKRTIVKSFQDTSISSSILYELEEAAFSALGFSVERPFFFLEIRRRDFIEQFEMLGELEEESSGASQVTCVFLNPEVPFVESDAMMALSAFLMKASEKGIMGKPIHLRKVFNDPRHKELKEICAVPKGYVCLASFALGYPKDVEEIEIETGFQLSAYVQ